VTKQLKVYYLSQNRWNRTVTNPQIMLSGIWLRNAGFEIGDKINVEYENGKITISNMGQAEMSVPFYL